MKSAEFVGLLRKSTNWTEDRYGHFHMTAKDGSKFRLKIQATSVRLERQVNICDKNEWRKITGSYFKDVEYDMPTTKLIIGNKGVILR